MNVGKQAGPLRFRSAQAGRAPAQTGNAGPSARPAGRRRNTGPAVLLGCAAALCLPAWASAAQPEADTALQRVRAAEDDRVEVFERAARSVVCIFADRERRGGGSGVIIDERGYGLTNFHVVDSLLESRQGYGGLSDGKLYPLTVLGIDAGGDVAMFKISGKKRFEAAPLGDSDDLHVGQWVAAMGNPFLVAEDFYPTITFGVISGLRRYQEGRGNLLEYADCIQVSTSINPGNSGGPLFNLDGEVIGINGRASFEERGRVNVGLGYAISVNQIKRFLPWLRAGQFVEHGTLGATVRAINPGGDDGRVIVDAIQAFSAAEQAGLELGDEILSVAGRRIRTPNDFNNILAIMPQGWPVRIEYARDGESRATVARLDRLVLPTRLTYIPNLDHNHAELRALLAALRERWGLGASQENQALTWTGALTVADSDVLPIRWSSLDATLDFKRQQQRTAETEAAPASQGNAGVSPARAMAGEWRILTEPLVSDPPLTVDWEYAGGDESAGRIAAVIERRLDDGRRVRWKLDYDTAELLEVEFAGNDENVTVTWRPGELAEFAAGRWPATWLRNAGASQGALAVESFERAAPTTAPAMEREP